VERSYDGPLPTSLIGNAAFDFDSLFHAYYPRLARLLHRIAGDATRAEEIASEAFWRLYRKPPPVKSNLEGWLYRTGVRLAMDRLKMERRRARYEALAAAVGIAVSPQQGLEQREESARVQRVLSVLKSGQTTLIVMRGEGFSYAEIAAALNCKPASVGAALARAEQAFRKEYVKRYGER
jgi:RNA polymerase sigma-70 factor, ECF subfamily